MEGTITGILKRDVEGDYDLESMLNVDGLRNIETETKSTNSADLLKVKDLIRDIYTGLNVKELKRRYSSFDLNFDRNWSWESRVKNVQSILEQYVTIDNYVNTIDNTLDQSERFIESNNYLSVLQDIEELTNSTLTKLGKRYRKVKNYDSIIKTSLTNISDHINNNFDEISDYESKLSSKEVKLNLFSPGEAIFREEPVVLPIIKSAEDFPYEISERTTVDTIIRHEVIPDDSIQEDKDDPDKIIEYFDNNQVKEEKNTLDIPSIPLIENEDSEIEQPTLEDTSFEKSQDHSTSTKITDYIEREKAQARVNVRNWFSEMTKSKNPAQYLESRLQTVGYRSNCEQEIVQVYSELLNEKVSDPFWRKVFGEKKSKGFFQRVSNYFENRKINSIENVIGSYNTKWNNQAEILRERLDSISETDGNYEKEDFTDVLTKMVQGDNGKGGDIDRIDPFFKPFKEKRRKPRLVSATVATTLIGGSLVALGYGASYAHHANETNQETLDWIKNYGSQQGLTLNDLDKEEFVPQLRTLQTEESGVVVHPEIVEENSVNYVPLTIGNIDRIQSEIPEELNSRFGEISSDYQFRPTFMNYFPGEMNLNEESEGLQADQERVVMLSYGTPNPVLLRGSNPEEMIGFNSLTEHSQYFINEIYNSRGELREGDLIITGEGFDAEVSQIINGQISHTSYHKGKPVINV